MKKRSMDPGLGCVDTAPGLILRDIHGRSTRRDYIVAKYVEHKFARRSTPDPQKLRTAICNRDLLAVLEAFASGQDFGQPLPGPEGQVRAPAIYNLLCSPWPSPPGRAASPPPSPCGLTYWKDRGEFSSAHAQLGRNPGCVI